MVRVINIAGLNGMPAGSGRLVVRVDDPVIVAHSGVYIMESVDGKLQVTRTDDTPDCTLSVHGLTALIYGLRDPGEFALRGWGNPSPETQAMMRAMFPATQPFMYATF